MTQQIINIKLDLDIPILNIENPKKDFIRVSIPTRTILKQAIEKTILALSTIDEVKWN